jgi:hypothetical protein
MPRVIAAAGASAANAPLRAEPLDVALDLVARPHELRDARLDGET